jgi:hypothetical protein
VSLLESLFGKSTLVRRQVSAPQLDVVETRLTSTAA